MPLESLKLEISLTLKQQEFLRAIDDYREILFGGGRGGGKSRGLRSIHLIRRIQMPKSKGTIWRRTYPELEKNHIRPLFVEHPQLKEFYNEQKRLLTLPNGSTQEFAYAESVKALPKAQGTETDDLGLEEAGDWDEQEYEMLLATNRSTLYQPRAQLTANPGGRGHGWLKKRFVTSPTLQCKYIQALLEDNPALIDNDPAYAKMLESIKSEALRKAWRYGDWDIAAGQYFSELNRNVHIVKDFPIPDHWQRFAAYDYGFSHPCSLGWYAVDEDGTIYKYRELVRARMKISEVKAEFWKHKDSEKVRYVTAGHDCWQAKGAAFGDKLVQPTIAEEFSNPASGRPIFLIKANIDRKQGWFRLREYLSLFTGSQGEVSSKFRFFEACPLSFSALSRMIHDPDDLEDVSKIDSVEGDPETGDDAADESRMAIMSRPALTLKVEKYKHDPWATKPAQGGWTTV